MMIWAWIRGKLEHKWPYYGQKCSWWELWELSNEQLRPRKPKQGAERCYKVIPMRNWVSLNELVNQSKQLFFPVQVSVGISDSIIIESFKSSNDFPFFLCPNCLDVLLVKYWLCFLQRWLHPSQEIPTQWALIPPSPTHFKDLNEWEERGPLSTSLTSAQQHHNDVIVKEHLTSGNYWQSGLNWNDLFIFPPPP